MAAMSTTVPALGAALVTACLLWLNSFTPTFAIVCQGRGWHAGEDTAVCGMGEQKAANRTFSLVTPAWAAGLSLTVVICPVLYSVIDPICLLFP